MGLDGKDLGEQANLAWLLLGYNIFRTCPLSSSPLSSYSWHINSHKNSSSLCFISILSWLLRFFIGVFSDPFGPRMLRRSPLSFSATSVATTTKLQMLLLSAVSTKLTSFGQWPSIVPYQTLLILDFVNCIFKNQ